MQVLLPVQPLSRQVFQDYGNVIETENSHHFPINRGRAERYHDLASLQLTMEDGKPIVSIFQARPYPRPIQIKLMERHPLGSQAFMPLSDRPFLVVAARKGATVLPQDIQVFLTNGKQGVNYHTGVWHHPLLAIAPGQEFLVIDRAGAGNNCDEIFFDDLITIDDQSLLATGE